DTFEVQIEDTDQRRLVAAIELVSPANKDRPDHRRDFVVKCASYLQQSVSLVVVDVVTERHNNLHVELMQFLEMPLEIHQAADRPVYAVAYRIQERADTRRQLELWPEVLSVGDILPTLPLWIAADLAVPLNLDESYNTAMEALRLA